MFEIVGELEKFQSHIGAIRMVLWACHNLLDDKFQSHIGAIRMVAEHLAKRVPCEISIPHWCN